MNTRNKVIQEIFARMSVMRQYSMSLPS